MESGFVQLLKPFDYKMTFTIKNNQIYSTLSSIISNNTFTTKVSGLSLKDFFTFSNTPPSFFIRRLSVNQHLQQIHFNKGLQGGGGCKSLACKKPEKNLIRKSILDIQGKLNNLQIPLKIAETLSKEMETGTVSKETLKKLLKLNQIENNDQSKIFDMIISKFSCPAIFISPFYIEERHKIAQILRNFLVFSHLTINVYKNNNSEDIFLKREEILENLISQIKDRNSLEEQGTLFELEMMKQLERKEQWSKMMKYCPALIRIVLGSEEEFSEVDFDNCEKFLVDFNKIMPRSSSAYLPILLEFYFKYLSGKIFSEVHTNEDFIKKLFEGFKEMTENNIAILLNFVLRLAEDKLITDDLLNWVLNRINDSFPIFDEGQKLRCCFFMKVIKTRCENDIKSLRKIFYINVFENESSELIKKSLFSPKFTISSLKTFKKRPFLKGHLKNNVDFAVNKKDLFTDYKRISKIFKYFTENNPNSFSNVFNIFGDRSLGKTRLSLNYMLKYQQLYQVIFFIKCKDRSSIISEFNKCCKLLDSDSFDSGVFGLENNLMALNSTQENILIVLDDVQNAEDFHQFYVNNTRIKYILTSRVLLVPTTVNFGSKKQGLSENSAISLLSTYLNDFNQNNLIKSQIVQMFFTSAEKIKFFASYLISSKLQLSPDILSKLESTLEYFPSRLFQALIENLNHSGKALLKILTFFEPEGIPQSLVQEIFLTSSKSSDFPEGKKALMRTLLIDEYESKGLFFSIEATFLEFIADLKTAELGKIFLEQFNIKLAEDRIDTGYDWESVKILLPHALKVVQSIQEESLLKTSLCILIDKHSFSLFGRLPIDIPSLETLVSRLPNLSESSEFELKLNLSLLFTDLKLFAKAETYFARCLNIIQNNQSLSESFMGKTCVHIGVLYKAMGRYERAESFFQAGRSTITSSLQAILPLKSFLCQALSDFYLEIGKFSEFSSNFQESFTLFSQNHGKNSSVLLKMIQRHKAGWMLKVRNFEQCRLALDYCLDDSTGEEMDGDKAETFALVGNMYLALENWTLAKEFHVKSARIRESLFELSSPVMAEVYFNFGQVCKGLKKIHQAKVFFYRALDIFKATFEENHLKIAEVFIALADVEVFEKRFEEASVLFNKGLNLKNLILPRNHPDFAEDSFKLGEFYRGLKDLPSAKQSFLNSLEIIENSFVNPNENKPKVLKILGIVCRDLRDFPESKKFFENCLNYRKNFFSEKILEISEVLLELGNLCLAAEDFQSSLTYFMTCLSYRTSVFESFSLEISEVHQKLGKTYLQMNDFQQSRIYLMSCYEVYRQVCKEGDLKLADICFDIGLLEMKEKNFDLSKEYLLYCLNSRKTKLDRYDQDLADIYFLFGELLHQASKSTGSQSARLNPSLTDAKDFIYKSLSIYEHGQSERSLANAYSKLGNIYNLLEEITESEKYFLKSVKIIEKQFKSGDEQKLIDARLALAGLYLEIKEFVKSEQQFLKVREIIGNNFDGFRKELIEACKGLYRIYYYQSQWNLVDEIKDFIMKLDPNAFLDENSE